MIKIFLLSITCNEEIMIYLFSEEDPMKELLDLFFTFARIGGLTFGGGYAMLPIIQKEVVEKRGWASEKEVMDYYAIGQCTPGVIAVNTATFIGYKNKGILGGVIATLGVVFPSLVIITIIALFIRNFTELEIVKHAFAGIGVCVCVLIINAVIKLGKTSIVDFVSCLIFLLVFIASVFFNLSPILAVLFSGFLGWLTKCIGSVKK